MPACRRRKLADCNIEVGEQRELSEAYGTALHFLGLAVSKATELASVRPAPLEPVRDFSVWGTCYRIPLM